MQSAFVIGVLPPCLELNYFAKPVILSAYRFVMASLLYIFYMIMLVLCLQANDIVINGQGEISHSLKRMQTLTTLNTNNSAGSICFNLKGIRYPNGSTVLRTDIEEDDAALQCTTNNTTCCSNNRPEMRSGEFYFPNGSAVPILERALGGYYRNRDSRLIRLNRQPNGFILGQFRCEIPNNNGSTVNLFINIVDDLPIISLLVTSSGTNVAGENYSLECSVVNTNDCLTYTVIWFDSRNMKVPLGMITTTSGVSTLWFDPVTSSHAGTYACTATQGTATLSKSVNVIVENPNVSAIVNNGQADPILGEWYFLNCTLMGAEKLIDADITYHWVKDGSAMLNQTTNTVTFTFLTLFDVGQYMCQATITSTFINEPLTTFSTAPLGIIPTLPDPTSVMVTSDPSWPIKPRNEITLTCTVVLSHILADFPSLRVAVVWSEPLGTLSGSDAVMTATDSLVYTSVLLIAASNENYTCQARVDSMSSSFTSSQIKANSIMITTDPNITIHLVDDGTPPNAGQSYHLHCIVIVNSTQNFNLTYYSWKKGGVLLSETGAILSFTTLRLSDTGQYVCEATISSHYFAESIFTTSNTLNVSLQTQVEVYMKLMDKMHSHGYSDSVFVITIVCGVVTAVIVIVIAATTITALKLVLRSRRASSDIKKNRFYPSPITTTNNTERTQAQSLHHQETTGVVQCNVSYQAIPLRSLQLTELQPDLTEDSDNGYTQCPLYDTRLGSTGSQLMAETSFSQTPVANS